MMGHDAAVLAALPDCHCDCEWERESERERATDQAYKITASPSCTLSMNVVFVVRVCVCVFLHSCQLALQKNAARQLATERERKRKREKEQGTQAQRRGRVGVGGLERVSPSQNGNCSTELKSQRNCFWRQFVPPSSAPPTSLWLHPPAVACLVRAWTLLGYHSSMCKLQAACVFSVLITPLSLPLSPLTRLAPFLPPVSLYVPAACSLSETAICC